MTDPAAPAMTPLEQAIAAGFCQHDLMRAASLIREIDKLRPVAAGLLCTWEGSFLDMPGRYICDLPEDSFAHQHSATCPPEHAPAWECHVFQAQTPVAG